MIAASTVSDDWVDACGGTETPFRTRTGRMLRFCSCNRTMGEHVCCDVERNVFLTDEESSLAPGIH